MPVLSYDIAFNDEGEVVVLVPMTAVQLEAVLQALDEGDMLDPVLEAAVEDVQEVLETALNTVLPVATDPDTTPSATEH